MVIFKARACRLIAAVFVMIVVAAGCASRSVPKPVMIASDAPAPPQQESVIAVPVRMNSLFLAQEMRRRFENPVIRGATKPISGAELLFDRSSSERVLVRKRIAPARPGRWTYRYRPTVREAGDRNYLCFSENEPWDWKVCPKTVTETVWRAIKSEVAPVAAKFVYVWRDVVSAIERRLETEVVLEYEVSLTAFDFQMFENDLRANASVSLDLSVHYDRERTSVGANEKLQGALDGRIAADIEMLGSYRLGDDLALRLDLPKDNTRVRFGDASFPTSVAGVDFSNFVEEQVIALLDTFSERINDAVSAELRRTLTANQDRLVFGDKVREFVLDNASPRQVASDIWISPNPVSFSFTQPVGSGEGRQNSISMDVGVIAKPVVSLSVAPPDYVRPDEIAVTVGAAPSGFEVHPLLFADYSAAAPRLRDAVNAVIAEKKPDMNYSVGELQMYPSDKGFVVGVQVSGGDGAEVFTAYLWGRPSLITQEGVVRVNDVDFTVETRNALVRLAAWFLDPKIQNAIEENAVFRYGDQTEKMLTAFRPFISQGEFGTITGFLDVAEPSEFVLRQSDVAMLARASGEVSFVSNDAAEELSPELVDENRITELLEPEGENRSAGFVEDFENFHRRITAELSYEEPPDEFRSADLFIDNTPRGRALREALGGDEEERVISAETARELEIIDAYGQIAIHTSDALAERQFLTSDMRQAGLEGFERPVGGFMDLDGDENRSLGADTAQYDIIIPREQFVIVLPDGSERVVRISSPER
ncbi:MAG: DUF4403 family protein [Pseudomonadota bacterium]